MPMAATGRRMSGIAPAAFVAGRRSAELAAARRAVDAFDAKSDALAVLEAVGAPVDTASDRAKAPAWYHPGRSGIADAGRRTGSRISAKSIRACLRSSM